MNPEPETKYIDLAPDRDGYISSLQLILQAAINNPTENNKANANWALDHLVKLARGASYNSEPIPSQEES